VQVPQWVARFNKYVTNPVQRLWAGRLKNITAAGSAELRHMGKTITLTSPRVMPKAEAAGHVTGFWRVIFPRLPFDSAVLLTRR
jgi:hypothetical protein